MSHPFIFKEFTIHQENTAMKVGTDGVLLGAWCSIESFPDTILDIGSGTGLLYLQLAQRTDALTIDAVEINAAAYEQTVENFEQSVKDVLNQTEKYIRSELNKLNVKLEVKTDEVEINSLEDLEVNLNMNRGNPMNEGTD